MIRVSSRQRLESFDTLDAPTVPTIADEDEGMSSTSDFIAAGSQLSSSDDDDEYGYETAVSSEDLLSLLSKRKRTGSVSSPVKKNPVGSPKLEDDAKQGSSKSLSSSLNMIGMLPILPSSLTTSTSCSTENTVTTTKASSSLLQPCPWEVMATPPSLSVISSPVSVSPKDETGALPVPVLTPMTPNVLEDPIESFATAYQSLDLVEDGQVEFSGLSDDSTMQILSFLDVPDLRKAMKLNKRLYHLIQHSDEGCYLWKDQVLQKWPHLEEEWNGRDNPSQAETTVKMNIHFHSRVQMAAPVLVRTKRSTQSQSQKSRKPTNYSRLLALASHHTPTKVDESILSPVRWSRSANQRSGHLIRGSLATEIRKVSVKLDGDSEVSNMPFYEFVGPVGHGDRSLRSDKPLPRPTISRDPDASSGLSFSKSSSSKSGRRRFLFSTLRLCQPTLSKHDSHLDCRPFVSPLIRKTENGLYVDLTPRFVSYYEVSILPNPKARDDTSRPSIHTLNPLRARASEDCVAIGLATCGFGLHCRMPGWDNRSFGYHGDDGGIFHGNGTMVGQYGPKFSAGDTVGCGIDYVNGSIFFTLNGDYLGTAFEDVSPDILGKDLYPVVGMDTRNLIQCNFSGPFQFDFTEEYEPFQQSQAVKEALG